MTAQSPLLGATFPGWSCSDARNAAWVRFVAGHSVFDAVAGVKGCPRVRFTRTRKTSSAALMSSWSFHARRILSMVLCLWASLGHNGVRSTRSSRRRYLVTPTYGKASPVVPEGGISKSTTCFTSRWKVAPCEVVGEGHKSQELKATHQDDLQAFVGRALECEGV
eukprot:scaffold364640_cov29-Prasinocladus_malaysianus.AAC.1